MRLAAVGVMMGLIWPAAASAGPGDTLGVYVGSGDAAAVAAFGQRLSRHIPLVHEYLDRRTWATITDAQRIAQHWTDAGYGNRVVFTVPMLPSDGGTLAQGAAGEYDAHFRTLAERLVAGGQGSAALRVGPEFNGNWFPWTIDAADGPQDYIAYWRRIVGVMRSVPGANFTFDWCANAGSSYRPDGSQIQAEDAYPGDAYVDTVGLDIYDQSWAPASVDGPSRWQEYLNLQNGLRWHADFAEAHGKQMTFPEWGLASRSDGHGGGDNPYFIEQMYQWIEDHDVAWSLYFESSDPDGNFAVFSGNFPNAAQRFVELFGYKPGPTGHAASETQAQAQARAKAKAKAKKRKLARQRARKKCRMKRVRRLGGYKRKRVCHRVAATRRK